MPWFRVDDTFWAHPKAIAAGSALALWLRAGCWSAQQLTDGYIPKAMLAMLGGTPTLAQRLVDASVTPDGIGLWTPVDGGWQFHDWANYQPSKQAVEERRAKRAKAGHAGGIASGTSRRNGSKNEATSEANASRIVEPPALPGPTQKQNPPASQARPSPPPRGQRLPDGFTPTPSMIDWARSKAPDVPASEHDAFVDYWRSQPGAKALKVDWEATWRTWMRRTQTDITAGRRPGAHRSTTDERVAQAQLLRDKYAAIDQAEATGIATVTHLAIGGNTP